MKNSGTVFLSALLMSASCLVFADGEAGDISSRELSRKAHQEKLRQEVSENREAARAAHEQSMPGNKEQDAQRLSDKQGIQQRYQQVLEEREKLKKLSPEERQQYREKRKQERSSVKDKNSNKEKNTNNDKTNKSESSK